MVWVIASTLVVCLLVNLPVLYSLFALHGREGLGELWGFTPNQFLFLVVFFPFACFFTFVGLRILVTRVTPKLPTNAAGRELFDNWPATLVLALIVASLLSVIVYYYSAMSFDKLEPRVASGAVNAAKEVSRRINSMPEEKREQMRLEMIEKARTEAKGVNLEGLEERDQLQEKLLQLPPEVFLQIVQEPGSQLRFKLLNPTLHALNVLQLVLGLFVATCALGVTVFCVVAARQLGEIGELWVSLKPAVDAVFYALVFFAIYPLCYRQHRTELEELIGSGSTVLQDVFSGFMVVLVLMVLRSVGPSGESFAMSTVLRFSPILIVGSGFAAEVLRPEIMRQLIGTETRVGIQLILSIICVVLAIFPVSQVWLSTRE